MKNKIVYIFAHSIEPDGISGSETILIETFKRISHKFKEVVLFTWKPGLTFYKGLGLNDITYKISSLPLIKNFYISFFMRCMYGFWKGLTFKISDPQNTILYPGSDFWPDTVPSILLKLRYPKTFLLGNFYLTAPNPFFGFREGSRKFKIPTLNNILYWAMQKPVYFSLKHLANAMIVTSEPDKKKFPKHADKTYIVKGGVDITSIEKYIESHPRTEKKYDAVFMGRFHPQKGVLDLLTIWKKVIEKLPHAQLVMIGDGQLMDQVKHNVTELHLEKNVTLTGYILNTDTKYEIFQQSKLVVHPAIYDSGGMAAAEAMAFNLPAVSFDLEALKTYYPKGMLKVKINDLQGFADTIIELLINEKKYSEIQKDAKDLVYNQWNWDKRAAEVYQFIRSLSQP